MNTHGDMSPQRHAEDVVPSSSVSRRGVLRSGAALGVASFVLPSAAAAASTSTLASTTYTTAEVGGKLYVWGQAFAPQALGTGVTGDVLTPRLMTGGTADFLSAEIVKVQPAYYASIALAADGSMFAWGWSNSGTHATTTLSQPDATQLTSWFSDNVASPEVPIPTPTIVDFSPSQAAVVAVGSDGHIYAWGTQWGSEAGLPTNDTTYAAPRRVTTTVGLGATVGAADRIIQVSGSRRVMIWLDGRGQVRTTGTQGASGADAARLGTGAGDKVSATAVVLEGSLEGTEDTADRIVQVAAGIDFGLALGRDGRIHAWGYNIDGRLGDASTTTRFEPVVINGAAGSALPAANATGRIIQVSAGNSHALALGVDGRVYSWGNAANGRLGTGSTDPVTAPVEITGNGALPAANAANRIVQVAAADSSSYALGSDGTVYSWGSGDGGRLGNGVTTDATLPVRIWDQGAFADLAPFEAGTQRRIVLLGVHRGSDESAHIFAIDNVSGI